MNDIINQIQQELVIKFPEANIYKHNERRYYISIPKDKIKEMALFLFQDKGFRLSIATGIDTRDGFEIIYHFSIDKFGTYFNIKVLISKEDPIIESITPILAAANWIEREIHELLGIDFQGHPNLKPLLTAENWPEEKFPLRRDYEQ